LVCFCYILAAGDGHKELRRHCPHACCGERGSSWDGENSKEEGISAAFLFRYPLSSLQNMFIIFVTPIVARLSCPREDTDSYWYLARSFWRPKGKISTVLCCLPGTAGTLSLLSTCHYE